MLDDAELVNGTIAYIRENHLSAARAFELRILEFESEWSRSGHAMLMDRLNDLLDIQVRVIRRLLGMQDPDIALRTDGERVVLVARDLTPTHHRAARSQFHSRHRHRRRHAHFAFRHPGAFAQPARWSASVTSPRWSTMAMKSFSMAAPAA